VLLARKDSTVSCRNCSRMSLEGGRGRERMCYDIIRRDVVGLGKLGEGFLFMQCRERSEVCPYE
jgi:hypothetical protein